MNADKRVVLEKHINTVLAEEYIPERTKKVTYSLSTSEKKIDKVAHFWLQHDGLNPLSRVIIKNINDAPRKQHHHPEHIIKDFGGHEHHGGHFSTFSSSGNWFWEQSAHLFGLFGRIFWEFLGYFFKLFVIIMIFWPTRTAFLILWGGFFLNTVVNTSIPVFITASIAGVIHGIFLGIHKIGGWWEHSHGWHGHGGWHGHH